MYTLSELIEDLQHLMELHGDVPVRLATQPRYPFEHEIDGIAVSNPDSPSDTIVYIGEGSYEGYLPHDAAVALGWREGEASE